MLLSRENIGIPVRQGTTRGVLAVAIVIGVEGCHQHAQQGRRPGARRESEQDRQQGVPHPFGDGYQSQTTSKEPKYRVTLPSRACCVGSYLD